MDWLEEKLWESQERMQNLSLRWALMWYVLLSILGVVLATMVASTICERWQALILQINLADKLETLYFYPGYMSQEAQFLYSLVGGIQRWCVLFFAALGMFVGIWMFYRHKMQTPIEILLHGAEEIGKQNLNISCSYESSDEMGTLCAAFEQMRESLVTNRQEIWQLMEEQRRVNAAFAHDLRTPLTVAKGYVEFLNQYYDTGKLSKEQVEDYLKLTQEQIERIMDFIKTMKQLTCLEERMAQPSVVKREQLVKQVGDIVHILEGKKGIKIILSPELEGEVLCIDLSLVLEVLENLLANSLSYAKSRVEIMLEHKGESLYLYVQDDGRGFTREELKKAQAAYYTGRETGGEHYGLGLYICSILCKKHGGMLDLGNSLEGGALITAVFSEI